MIYVQPQPGETFQVAKLRKESGVRVERDQVKFFKIPEPCSLLHDLPRRWPRSSALAEAHVCQISGRQPRKEVTQINDIFQRQAP